MASDNETVADIVREMVAAGKPPKVGACESPDDYVVVHKFVIEWADRIAAAHKRAIKEAVKPIEANYEFMLKQFADKEDQYVRCRIELNDASKNLDECKAELEKARENGKQMWLNALHNSTSKSELHQMLMQAVQEKYKEELAAKDREIAELRERIKIAEVALEKIDNMCDGDMCKFFDETRHCSACRYLNECQTGVAHAALAAIRGKGANNGK